MSSAPRRRLREDRRGAIYVETLIAFLPVFTFFLATIQAADLSVAHLVVEHASSTAARAAVVVLPDDGIYYEDHDNAQLHQYSGLRRSDVELAADLVLEANPRLSRTSVELDKQTYAQRDDLTATVRAAYRCLLPALCGGGINLESQSKLVYQGAKFVYEPTSIGEVVTHRPSRRPQNQPGIPSDPSGDPSSPGDGPTHGNQDGNPANGDPQGGPHSGRPTPTDPNGPPHDTNPTTRPNEPNRPNAPNTPTTPSTPNTPNTPNTPDAPNTPDTPNRPGTPNAPNTRPGVSAPNGPNAPSSTPGATPSAPSARPGANSPNTPNVPGTTPGASANTPSAKPAVSTPNAPSTPSTPGNAPGATPNAPAARPGANTPNTPSTQTRPPSSPVPNGPIATPGAASPSGAQPAGSTTPSVPLTKPGGVSAPVPTPGQANPTTKPGNATAPIATPAPSRPATTKPDLTKPQTPTKGPSPQPSRPTPPATDQAPSSPGAVASNGNGVWTDEQGRRRLPVLNPQCFVAGTLVATEHGPVAIEHIRPGDRVFSYDERRQSVVSASVSRSFARTTTKLYELTIRAQHSLDDALIKGTGDHPFYVPAEGRYVALEELAPGTELLTFAGLRAEVLAVRAMQGRFEVFNFEVQGEHNYFVQGSTDPPDAVLVHNDCETRPTPNPARGETLHPRPNLEGRADAERLRDHYDALDAHEAKYQARVEAFEAFESEGPAPTTRAEARQAARRERQRRANENKVSEAVGERALTDHMLENEPGTEMVLGFAAGQGVDQIWVRRNADGSVSEFIIAEAKGGPNAELADTKSKGKQMSQQWVEKSIEDMAKSSDPATRQLGKDIQRALKSGTPPVTGIAVKSDGRGGSSQVEIEVTPGSPPQLRPTYN